MKKVEERIVNFFTNPFLRTVCGAPFEVLDFDRDGNEGIKGVIGTVKEKIVDGAGQESEKDIEMYWSTNGSAICNNPLIYDLVVRKPISELVKEVLEASEKAEASKP